MREADRWRVEVFRHRLTRSLAARFLLRFHVTLMLAASVLSGWLVDAGLLHAGWRDMRWRYPLAIVAAYLGFLGAVRAWLAYSGIGEQLERRKAEELLAEPGGPPRPPWFDRPRLTWDWLWAASDPEGCLVIVVLTVAFFALGGYVVMAAPEFFADVVLEVLLAAGLLRGIRRAESSGWVRGVWRSTRGSLAFTLLVALAFAAWAHRFVPSAATAAEALGRLHQARPGH